MKTLPELLIELGLVCIGCPCDLITSDGLRQAAQSFRERLRRLIAVKAEDRVHSFGLLADEPDFVIGVFSGEGTIVRRANEIAAIYQVSTARLICEFDRPISINGN